MQEKVNVHLQDLETLNEKENPFTLNEYSSENNNKSNNINKNNFLNQKIENIIL